MTKTWRCTQCQTTYSKGLVDSFSGPPESCDNCQNEEFEVVGVTGRLHRTLDDPAKTVQSKRTRRRVLSATGGSVVVLGGAWWLFGRPEVVETNEVSLRNAQFHPRNIEVDVGEEVTWTNDEGDDDMEGVGEGPATEPITYIIQSATTGWEFEEELEEDDSVSYTFEEGGIYALYEVINGSEDLSGMSMKIGVGEEIEEPVGGWF